MERSQQLERTKSDIFNAILRLLSRDNIEKISISDIASEAKISRATFYLHFTDKYDALYQLADIYTAPLLEILRTICSFNERVPLEQLDHMFESFYTQNGPILRQLLEIQSPYFMLRQRVYDLFLIHIKEIAGSLSDLEQQMMTGIMSNFFIYYLNHDSPDSFVSTLFTSYQKITLVFLGMDTNGPAKLGLEKLIEKYSWDHANPR